MTENMILYYIIEKNYYTAYTAPYRGGSAAYKNNASVTYSALPENKGRKLIINTGMRTDIPAFYSGWFRNRIRAGYVLVRNPYRQDWITRYDLDPYGVD